MASYKAMETGRRPPAPALLPGGGGGGGGGPGRQGCPGHEVRAASGRRVTQPRGPAPASCSRRFRTHSRFLASPEPASPRAAGRGLSGAGKGSVSPCGPLSASRAAPELARRLPLSGRSFGSHSCVASSRPPGFARNGARATRPGTGTPGRESQAPTTAPPAGNRARTDPQGRTEGEWRCPATDPGHSAPSPELRCGGGSCASGGGEGQGPPRLKRAKTTAWEVRLFADVRGAVFLQPENTRWCGDKQTGLSARRASEGQRGASARRLRDGRARGPGASHAMPRAAQAARVVTRDDEISQLPQRRGWEVQPVTQPGLGRTPALPGGLGRAGSGSGFGRGSWG
ncbi:translation initiation factor IF-2-like [Camelus ferus]|uniref:Translation initiation factor IF-2-like n=1 Tax=Camelus ferus TaxID=419612 RepID=A0A8B8TB93_CAMFR|nr:translation initiation factor IF-2-like [Camelus ferus]